MIFDPPIPGMHILAHEVVQTSAMDCGPAALKSILEGFGIPVSYGRLREACQTDVDGTSIDTMEDLALQLGLQAEQIMVPAEHILIDQAQVLPAIAVVRLPSGLTHFLVIWQRFGNRFQVMDPSTGRRWPSWEQLSNELYIHTMPVPSQAWRDWAGSPGLLVPLKQRLLALEIPEIQTQSLIDSATEDPGWYSLASLDAAVRMVSGLVKSKGIPPGLEAGKLIERFYRYQVGQFPGQPSSDQSPSEKTGQLSIPPGYWSVLPTNQPGDAPEPMVLLRGIVLVRITGIQEPAETSLGTPRTEEEQLQPLSKELEAALREPARNPLQEVWNALKADGLLTPSLLALAVVLSTLTVIIEAVLIQGMLRIGQTLGMANERFWAFFILMGFIIAPLLLELPAGSIALRMGRRIETRLRITFLEKIPRLGDRYFHSRLTSDMTQRAYDLRQLRSLPNLAVSLLRTASQLLLTTLGIIWLDPASALLALSVTIIFILLYMAFIPFQNESDLRYRTNTGALSRFYLDALLGLVPIKSHGAERSLRREHEIQLHEWQRVGRQNYNLSSLIQSVSTLFYSAFSVLIILNYVQRGGQQGELLLIFYWTLSLPTIGLALVNQVQRYPMLRNRIIRLLEPLNAPDEELTWTSTEPDNEPMDESLILKNDSTDPIENQFQEKSQRQPHEVVSPATPLTSVSLSIQHVNLVLGGKPILKDIHLTIPAGEHLGIIGPSGAGKSSLVGLFLGWHHPASGEILIDGQVLDGYRIKELREQTAWVDPAVQLWNWSLYENLRFGNDREDSSATGQAIQNADLFAVLERMPNGLKTQLGEGGGLVSGGEGQRVRLGRALARKPVRLVILDEPFRGLDRGTRRKLLHQARDYWKSTTLICITHDVTETMNFDRVVVIEEGSIVEQGNPQELADQAGSRYASLLSAEKSAFEDLWSSNEWKRWELENGKLNIKG